MQLNLPVLEKLSECKSLLIAGMGGGFDVFCGLPVYFELRRRGLQVHLGNLSFSNIAFSKAARLGNRVRLSETLVGVTWETEELGVYFPELYLAQWFQERRGEAVTVWCFKKTGFRPLLDNYRMLVEHLGVDGILLVDGGVDSLMRGDEAEMGTVLEDAVSLLAVSELQGVPIRLVGCLGFGAERDVSYAHVLENIAALAEEGGFLGSCSLVRQMPVYREYEDAVLYVQGKPFQEESVINSSVISAVRGHYGDYHLTEKTRGSRLWISPLMPVYWFFDLPAVVRRHLFLPQLLYTDTFNDALLVMWQVLQMRSKRVPAKIPLS